MPQPPLDLVQGTLDVMILRCVAGEPLHGYAISQWIRNRTEGVLQVQDAALYQALRRLEKKGWVQAQWGLSENNRRARYYSLTPEGGKQLRLEIVTWRRYAAAVSQVLEPAPGEAG